MRVITLVVSFVGFFCAANAAHAVSDIELTSTTPYAIHVPQGDSGSFSVTVTNHGPDAVAPILVTTSINWIYHGYTLSLTTPVCGVLTGVSGSSYSITLPVMEAGDSLTCSLDIARDTSIYSANDLPLFWEASVPDDSDWANNYVGFAVGSLIDLSVAIVPVSFEIDDGGVGHAVDRLVVASHGPTAVENFVIGACTDHGPPDFYIDGNIEGGCGSAEFGPFCFDSGFGFLMPAMAPGDVYSCTIALTGVSRYEGPVRFGIGTDVLNNPDLGGGNLLDMKPDDNRADLVLGPVSDEIFAGGFDG